MFARRLFQTLAGAVYVEADYDGVHALAFDSDGRVRDSADLTSKGMQAPAIETALRNDLKLGESESRWLATEVQTMLEDEGDSEDFQLWPLVVVMLGTVGVWVVGAAAIVAGVVYLVLRLT